MNELDYLSEVIKERKFSEDFALKELEKLKKLEDINSSVIYLCMLVQSIAGRLFRKAIKESKILLDKIDSEKLNDFEKRNFYYAYFLDCFSLGFASKTLEYGFKIETLKEFNPALKFNVYNIMCILLNAYDFYNEALMYLEKSLEYKDAYLKLQNNKELSSIFDLSYYNNLIAILINLNETANLNFYYDKMTDILKDINLNIEAKKVLEIFVKFTRLYIDYSFGNLDFNKYAMLMEEYSNITNPAFSEWLDEKFHCVCLDTLLQNKKYDQVLKIGEFIINNDRIDGDKCAIYKRVIEAIEHLDNEDINLTKTTYLIDYNERLIKQVDNYKGFVSSLISEQFKIRSLEDEVNEIKLKYKTDILTSCGSRASLLEDWENKYKNLDYVNIVFIDLDNLKQVNDKYGHIVGDSFLQKFANTVLEYLEDNMTIYRYAGDEFIIVSLLSNEITKKTMEKIYTKLALPVLIAEEEIKINFSYGVSIYPKEASNLIDLVKLADDRMYKQKGTKK